MTDYRSLYSNQTGMSQMSHKKQVQLAVLDRFLSTLQRVDKILNVQDFFSIGSTVCWDVW